MSSGDPLSAARLALSRGDLDGAESIVRSIPSSPEDEMSFEKLLILSRILEARGEWDLAGCLLDGLANREARGGLAHWEALRLLVERFPGTADTEERFRRERARIEGETDWPNDDFGRAFYISRTLALEARWLANRGETVRAIETLRRGIRSADPASEWPGDLVSVALELRELGCQVQDECDALAHRIESSGMGPPQDAGMLLNRLRRSGTTGV